MALRDYVQQFVATERERVRFIMIIIIKLYFRPQPIDTNIQIQSGKIYTIVSKIFIMSVKKQEEKRLAFVVRHVHILVMNHLHRYTMSQVTTCATVSDYLHSDHFV